MKFSWQDIYEIAINLEDTYPDVDILSLSFPKLKSLVESLPNFTGEGNANEGVLEAIQMAWLEDRE
ncbi:Protein IscX [Candidatus Hepatincola sp. Av]